MLRRRGFLAAAAGVGSATAGCLDGIGDRIGDGGTGDDYGAVNADDASEADYEFADRPTLIAHRGFAGAYPENTIDAFEAAGEESRDGADRRRADWIEVDARPTGDGGVVAFHDDELGDLTDTRGVVYETPASDVLSAEVLESGSTVPTLADALAAIPDEVGVNVEVKNGSAAVERGRVADPSREREEWSWLETVVDEVSRHDNEVLCSSFYEGALFAFREIDPSVPVAYVFSRSIEEGLAVTDEYDAAAASAPARMVEGTPYFDATSHQSIDLVGEVHDRGLPINVWTVQTWHQVEQLNAAGVDGLFLDYPGITRWGDTR